MMDDSSEGETDPDVRLVETERGRGVAHLERDGQILCDSRFETADEVDELPENGFCGNCKRFGERLGLVVVPGRD